MDKIIELKKNAEMFYTEIALSDVADVYTGKQLNKSDMSNDGLYAVMNGGIEASGYSNNYNEVENTITISQGGASAGYVNWNSEKIWLGAHCYAIHPIKNKINNRYLYFVLKEKQEVLMQSKQGAGIPGLNRSIIQKLYIPLPHTNVQKRIVEMLDSFTNLIDALKEELSLRQKQFEYYREKLYNELFDKTKEVELVKFDELGSITRGKRFVRDDIREQGQPCIHYGDMYTYYGVMADEAKTYLDRNFPKKMRYAKNGDVIIVGAGENNWDIGVGLAWLGEEPAAVHDACYIVKHNINPLFIAYYTRTSEYHQQLKKCVSEGKICSFSAEGLGKIVIPVPKDDAIQQSIVEKLDAFESLISSLKEEIALRQKQYEYYREKLLTFN